MVSSSLKILILTRYGRLGASSRLRFMQFVPVLEAAGLQCSVHALLDDEMLQERYRRGRYRLLAVAKAFGVRVQLLLQRQHFDLIWIEKEALPWFPAWLERLLLRGTPYVLDFDDAIFHNYDRHARWLVRHLWGQRVDRLMAGARLVICGNDYLAARARRAGAQWVEVLPTVVDLDRYEQRPILSRGDEPLRIVWIGSPGTLPYLASLSQPLAELARECRFVLRVIGARLDVPGVDVECLDWLEGTEVARVAECDVGIMPLRDSPWEQGKCGYKLIQYMACGLPVVATPVGVNCSIVQEGANGYLAATPLEWQQCLGWLLGDATLRCRMGQAGRARVEQTYCVQQVFPRLASLLRQAAAPV